MIFGIILKCCTKPLFVTTLKRKFAPEASNDDNLNFNKSAHEAATAIKNSEKYVSVVALNGGYGEGKSSHARMIIENIGIKNRSTATSHSPKPTPQTISLNYLPSVGLKL